MNYSDYLEQSSPKIKLSKQKIIIDTTFSNKDNLIIENIAGGFLNGQIQVIDDFILVSTNLIDKNLVDLEIEILSNKLIDNFSTTFLKIFSNGGDVEIVIDIIKEKSCFKIGATIRIYTIKDLFNFFERDIVEVADFFENYDFVKWLEDIDEKAKLIYDFIMIDDVQSNYNISEKKVVTTKENLVKTEVMDNLYRKIDNFFVLLGFKNSTQIISVENNIDVEIMPYQNNDYYGTIKLRKSDCGYCRADLSLKSNCDFFQIEKNHIGFNEFLKREIVEVPFKIFTSKIKNKREDIIININKREAIKIAIHKVAKINVYTDKLIYTDNMKGYISIENLLDVPVNFKAISENKNINILNGVGEINKKGEIDFLIKITTFNRGVFKFFKQPYFDCVINMFFEVNEVKIKKDINITIATENLEFK